MRFVAMRNISSITCAIVAGLFVTTVGAPAAHAQLSTTQTKCREGLAKEATKFVQGKQKAIQKCNDKNIKEAGSCIDLNETIAKLEQKLRDGIAKKCAEVNSFGLANMGYPGKCSDPNLADNFTLADLQECLVDTHEAAVDEMIDIEYGTTTGGLTQEQQKCQSEIAKSAGKFLVAKLKLIQKCRNDLNKGKLTGFAAENCASEPKTAEKIAKETAKVQDKIAGKCTDAIINGTCTGCSQPLDVCNPNATTVAQVQSCIVQTHGDEVDTTSPTAVDLIDIEYAAQPSCGDGIRNQPDEECDGPNDDAACDGLCGESDGNFPCLCTNIKRQAVIEHADADLDNGWTGISHDSGIVEGGSYVVDLYDCDNVTDFLCTVGPSCEVASFGDFHAPCDNNAQCQFFGLGNCRKTRQALGPHCNLDIQVVCDNDGDCPGIGNFCVTHNHGAPLPLSSGGVSVCVINQFSENVVGTTNLQDGSGAVRLRQNSATYLGPVTDQPCPVCGGFCAGNLGMGGGVGQRQRCNVDADCPNPPNHCVTDNICSYGENADKACRPEPPVGGPTDLFGNPSSDCGPPPGFPISGFPGLDILFNPATTGTTTLLPTFECDFPFQGNKCIGGTVEGKTCTSNADCLGGGTCNEQCFCPSGGGVQQRPNRCNSACRNGSNNGLPCANDAACPGGFCEVAACRPNPSDTDSSNEGACVAGPSDGVCSTTRFKGCSSDVDCQAANCSFCEPGETCEFSPAQCFVSSGIVRSGEAGIPDKKTAAIFCIAGTTSSAINSTAGLPGPGTITTPTTTEETGF